MSKIVKTSMNDIDSKVNARIVEQLHPKIDKVFEKAIMKRIEEKLSGELDDKRLFKLTEALKDIAQKEVRAIVEKEFYRLVEGPFDKFAEKLRKELGGAA